MHSSCIVFATRKSFLKVKSLRTMVDANYVRCLHYVAKLRKCKFNRENQQLAIDKLAHLGSNFVGKTCANQTTLCHRPCL